MKRKIIMTALLCAVSIASMQSAAQERTYTLTQKQKQDLFGSLNRLITYDIPDKSRYVQLITKHISIVGICYATLRTSIAIFFGELVLSKTIDTVSNYGFFNHRQEQLNNIKALRQIKDNILPENNQNTQINLNAEQMDILKENLSDLSKFEAPSFIRNAFTNLAIAGACYYAASNGLFANPTFKKHALFTVGAWYLTSETNREIRLRVERQTPVEAVEAVVITIKLVQQVALV